jgi:four helix bundle protein
MAPYERLVAWQVAHKLALETYRVTSSFPKHELYGLTAQTRRAAFSVALNIAEGSAKRGPREFRRYLDISLGSLSELTCEFMLARDLGFLSPDAWKQLNEVRNHAGVLLWKLYRVVAKSGR